MAAFVVHTIMLIENSVNLAVVAVPTTMKYLEQKYY